MESYIKCSPLLPQRHNYRRVENEEAKQLISRYRKSKVPHEKNAILNRLIEGFMNIARHQAAIQQRKMKQLGYAVDFEDLLQEGAIGIFKAIDSADLDRPEPFVAFAAPLIRHAIWKAASASFINPSMKIKMGLVRRAIHMLKSKNQPQGETEILNTIHAFPGKTSERFRLDDVRRCLEIMTFSHKSLNAEMQTLEGSAGTYADILPDDKSRIDEAVEAHMWLEKVWKEKNGNTNERLSLDFLIELDSEASVSPEKSQSLQIFQDFMDNRDVWMTVDELRGALCLADLTIQRRIKQAGIKAARDYDRGGRARSMYSLIQVKKACADLLSITVPMAGADGTFEQNGEIWGTISSIAKKLGKNRRTLRILKKEHDIRTLTGSHKTHRVTEFYSLSDFIKCA